MTWIAWVAIVGGLATALLWWLWRREVKARKRAEAAAKTHEVRAKAEAARAAEYELSADTLQRELAAVHEKYNADVAQLKTMKKSIDKAVAEEDDEELADLWNSFVESGGTQ